MKRCSECKTWKDRSDYHRDRSRYDGVCHRCKTCNGKHSHSWMRANRERVNARLRARYHSSPRKKEVHLAWRKANREHIRMKTRETRYGMTGKRYEEVLVEQGGLCAICRCKETTIDGWDKSRVKSLAVDHDHITNTARGLLCTRCNTAIERLESIPGWEALARAYLDRYAPSEKEKAS